MDYKKFNLKASPEDIERLRDYRKDLKAIQIEIYTVTNDMKVIGITEKLIKKKKALFIGEDKVKKLISDLMKKYDCN